MADLLATLTLGGPVPEDFRFGPGVAIPVPCRIIDWCFDGIGFTADTMEWEWPDGR